jgi:hypothetical protein
LLNTVNSAIRIAEIRDMLLTPHQKGGAEKPHHKNTNGYPEDDKGAHDET